MSCWTPYIQAQHQFRQTVLGNDVIEGLATCGEWIDSHTEMCHCVQWAIGYNANTGLSMLHGNLLLGKLQAIYAKFEEDAATDEARLAKLQAGPSSIPSSKTSIHHLLEHSLREALFHLI